VALLKKEGGRVGCCTYLLNTFRGLGYLGGEQGKKEKLPNWRKNKRKKNSSGERKMEWVKEIRRGGGGLWHPSVIMIWEQYSA